MGEGSTNDLYRLNLSSQTWSQVATKGTPPEPRSFHAMVAVKGKLYVFGGCGTSGRLSDLHRFDCEDESWEQLPSSEAIKVTHQTIPSMHMHLCLRHSHSIALQMVMDAIGAKGGGLT